MNPPTVVDWLLSPGGVEATHAVVLLVVAVTAWLNWRIKRKVDENARQLNGHLAEHMPAPGEIPPPADR